jgi:DNA-binding MarR family transcriptional regulator
MEQPKLTSAQAEQIVNTLRNNPGVSMTLADIADATGIELPDLAAHLEELAEHNLVIKETAVDGFDTYRFPHEYQRGSTGNAT